MVINFAHRGSLKEAPENTVASMKKALEHHTKAIELDVQLTKDGYLIVVHDNKWTRLNKSVRGLIKDYTLDEIKRIDVGSSFSSAFKGETLATLEEILEVVPNEVLLNVEIKNLPNIYHGIEQKVLDVLESHHRLDNVVISSFDHVALQKIQALHADIPIGMLISNRLIDPWEYVKNTGLTVTSVHPLYTIVSKEFIEQFHDVGLKVFPYTVDKMEHYQMLLDMGVDGVFSNNPKIFSMKED